MTFVLVTLRIQIKKCHQDGIRNDYDDSDKIDQIQFMEKYKRPAAPVEHVEKSKIYEYAGYQQQSLPAEMMPGKIRMQPRLLYKRKYALAQEI